MFEFGASHTVARSCTATRACLRAICFLDRKSNNAVLVRYNRRRARDKIESYCATRCIFIEMNKCFSLVHHTARSELIRRMADS